MNLLCSLGTADETYVYPALDLSCLELCLLSTDHSQLGLMQTYVFGLPSPSHCITLVCIAWMRVSINLVSASRASSSCSSFRTESTTICLAFRSFSQASRVWSL